MKKWVVFAALAACRDPSPPVVESTAITSAVGQEPKAKPLTGAHEITETLDGKRYRIQMKYEEGELVAQMLWQDSVPIIRNEITSKGGQIRFIRSVTYDSTGTPILISEHKLSKESVFGRLPSIPRT